MAMRRRHQAGFSLVEVLIAAFLLLIVILGVLPLFMRSTVANETGSSSNRVATLARLALEDLHQLPFDSPRLEVSDGAQLEVVEQYNLDTKVWEAEDPDATETALWLRTTTVRQYGVAALTDGNLDEAEALPAGTDPEFVHFKELQVRVESRAGGAAFGPNRSVTLRTFKSQ